MDYTAEWILDRKGPAQGSLYRGSKKILLVKGGERTVVPEIEKILGLDKNMFLQSVYVKQGEIEKLVTARAGERKELISRLLGVEDLDRAWNGMKDIIQTYKDKQTSLEAELKRKPKVTQQKNDLGDKIKNQKGELEKDKRTQDGLIKKVAETKNALESYNCRKNNFDQINHELNKINQNISNVENNILKEQTELKKALTAQILIKDLESEINKLPLLETFSLSVAEMEVHQVNLKALQDKMTEITHLSAVLQNNFEDYKIYSLKEQEIVEKQKQRKSFEGANASLKDAVNQLDRLEKQKTNNKRHPNKRTRKMLQSFKQPGFIRNYPD